MFRLLQRVHRGRAAIANYPLRMLSSQGGPPRPGGQRTGFEKEGDGYESEGEEGKKEFESDKRFSNFVLFGGALAMVILLMASNVQQSKRERERQQKLETGQRSTTTYTGKADIGGPWKLYNTKGELVTHKDFTGKYYLIYFGFTFCPDVCPISLMKLSSALNKVRESKEYAYFDLDAIFVSVDPNRDSNPRIEEYVKIFHPDLVGLTHKSNDNQELKDMLKKFKIHVSKIFLTEEDEKEDFKSLQENAPEVVEKMKEVPKPEKEVDEKYTLDHTIVVYLMGPDNEFLTYLGSNLDDNAMKEIILDEIAHDLKRKVMPKH